MLGNRSQLLLGRNESCRQVISISRNIKETVLSYFSKQNPLHSSSVSKTVAAKSDCSSFAENLYQKVGKVKNDHCVKSVRIRSYSGPHFPAFVLNTERNGVSLRIQSECGKMGTRITPNTDTFHAVDPIPNSNYTKDNLSYTCSFSLSVSDSPKLSINHAIKQVSQKSIAIVQVKVSNCCLQKTREQDLKKNKD